MNLLSTGILDDEGFSLDSAQCVWKLVKDSLIVFKGKCCSIYNIDSNLFQGEVNVS